MNGDSRFSDSALLIENGYDHGRTYIRFYDFLQHRKIVSSPFVAFLGNHAPSVTWLVLLLTSLKHLRIHHQKEIVCYVIHGEHEVYGYYLR